MSQTNSTAASAGTVSLCVALSRITGFARTWAMAYALGATFLSSSYQVANNLPNQLYELVMGGMLVTAFLPVYIEMRRKGGRRGGREYASALFTLVVILLGIVSVAGMVFPQAIIYTQSFMSDQDAMGTAVLLFQFFSIQTVFYGASSVVSGLLNAHREYFWSSVAPIANNVIVIATFLLYAVVAPSHPAEALYIIALGNPLGVVAQFAIQVPHLHRAGIKLTFRLRMPAGALRETLRIGAPAMLVMGFSFVTVSVMNAASYCFADNGPSVIAYARLWYTLPYSFLAIPITTVMFTELSEMHAEGNIRGLVRGIQSGTAQIMFLLIPFMLYLIVFADPLVALYHMGAFEADRIGQIADFLAALALALPFYGVSSYLQKIFSTLRRMGVYAVLSIVSSVVQVVFTLGFAFGAQAGMALPLESVAWGSVLFYGVLDVSAFIYLRWFYPFLHFRSIFRASLRGLVMGGAGAVAGAAVLAGLQPLMGTAAQSIPGAFALLLVGGVVSLAVTFGIALKRDVPEAALVRSFADKFQRLGRRLLRRSGGRG